MSRSRKHGVFAVSSELIVLPIKNHEMKRDSLNIISANEDYRKLSENN